MPAILLVFTCALWGLSFPVMKALHLEQALRLPQASTLFLSAWMQVARFGLGSLILLPFVSRSVRPTRLELRQGLWIALWGGLGMGIQADGLAHTDASISAFLTQGYCIFLPLWACLKRRKPPGMRVLVATLLVLCGGALLSGVRLDHLRLGRGEWETILAAFLFTFQILLLEDPKYVAIRGMAVTFVMFVGITAMFAPITLLLANQPLDCLSAGASLPACGLILVLALFCSVCAYLLMNIWQPRVPATEAGLIYTAEPVFTAIYVLFLPGLLGAFCHNAYSNETLTSSLLGGGALIVVANGLMQWKRQPHPPAVAPVQ
ncbi:MAG: DMT family transporter [Verrucomicrobia bacterium]|nr:MAG: DMT family transporter [Verrucomicrobiota bacterium]